MRKKLIYVCSRYSGDVERNSQKARRYSSYVVSRGNIPITPHLLFPQFVSSREQAMALDLELLKHCDELWVFGIDSGVSDGMGEEIMHASEQEVRYFTEDCEEVFD